MSADVEREIADMAGAAALPRQNGELVFAEAWEGRVFGMAIALHERGAFDWNEFRAHLIAEIAERDAAGDESGYYERWLAAFERLLDDRGLLSLAELEARTAEFASGLREDVY